MPESPGDRPITPRQTTKRHHQVESMSIPDLKACTVPLASVPNMDLSKPPPSGHYRLYNFFAFEPSPPPHRSRKIKPIRRKDVTTTPKADRAEKVAEPIPAVIPSSQPYPRSMRSSVGEKSPASRVEDLEKELAIARQNVRDLVVKNGKLQAALGRKIAEETEARGSPGMKEFGYLADVIDAGVFADRPASDCEGFVKREVAKYETRAASTVHQTRTTTATTARTVVGATTTARIPNPRSSPSTPSPKSSRSERAYAKRRKLDTAAMRGPKPPIAGARYLKTKHLNSPARVVTNRDASAKKATARKALGTSLPMPVKAES